jgi:hypothetical protein
VRFADRIFTLILATVALIAPTAVILSRAHVIASSSVDVANHYALAKELHDFGRRTVWKSYLGEMSIYPPLSHWVIALLSTYVGIIRAFSIVSIGAVLIVYFCLCRLAIQNSLWKSLLVLSVFFLLVRGFASLQAVSGYEVIGNFFFPQMFGDALAFLSILVILTLTSPFSISRLLLVSGAVWLVAYAHLVPAVYVFGVFFVLFGVDLVLARVDLRRATHRTIARIAFLAGGYCGLGLFFVEFHPGYAAMTYLSSNNGSIGFDSRPGLLALFVSLLAAAVVLTLAIRFKSYGLEKNDSCGMAMVFAAVFVTAVQFGMLELFGKGSPYAFKKHVFHLVTVMSFVMATEAAVWWDIVTDRFPDFFKARFLKIPLKPARATAVAAIAASIIVASFYPWKPEFDQARLARLQRVAESLPRGKVILPFDGALPASMNYLVYIGDLRRPRDQTGEYVRTGNFDRWLESTPSPPTAADYVITDQPARFYLLSTFAPRTKLVVYGTPPAQYKFVAPQPQPFAQGSTVKFGGNEMAEGYLVKGWSQIESWGVWSESAEAALLFRVDAPGRYLLKLKAQPFLGGIRTSQTVQISMNGHPVLEQTLASSTELGIPFRAPPDSIVQIDFEVANPVSPYQLGISDDRRALGIGLILMSLAKEPSSG